ncbi:MAG: ABC transporter permease subunit [Candidatus Scalindua sp.]|jgi:ABC-type transport system involved in multi-copper enzyme maturation permease subunit|nr:ABC transporter permease subunit [Candidatus Scalindua sp.]MBT5304373.1 ABC transporter permease subunit [Candidatus Scalindua sp.]MBT6051012.1 ABC transporter permease subunit [Candidatus Scalindua sp.]MBT6228836.1 ABC transporter permease subunit [Candidatus Scalindua sp.]MBT6564948.1 ABC transporter permease subunit [Candidatus Scalindua sp.]
MNILIPLVFSSFREIVRQPFYYIILLSGCFIILLSFVFTFFAFGEEARMIRDMAISTITIGGLLAGCLSSSILIAGEFERQTVLAVLCKPVARIHFILGKYLGILAATFLLVFSQGLVLEIALIIRNYSVQYDTTSFSGLIDFVCMLGICFSLLQILILTAISLVLSLYLNTISNLAICLLFFIFCNSFNYILPIHNYSSTFVSIGYTMCYAVIPNLQSLNMAAINEVVTAHSTPWQESNLLQYVVCNIIYCTIYSAIAVWLAVFLFKRKEIA